MPKVLTSARRRKILNLSLTFQYSQFCELSPGYALTYIIPTNDIRDSRITQTAVACATGWASRNAIPKSLTYITAGCFFHFIVGTCMYWRGNIYTGYTEGHFVVSLVLANLLVHQSLCGPPHVKVTYIERCCKEFIRWPLWLSSLAVGFKVASTAVVRTCSKHQTTSKINPTRISSFLHALCNGYKNHDRVLKRRLWKKGETQGRRIHQEIDLQVW